MKFVNYYRLFLNPKKGISRGQDLTTQKKRVDRYLPTTRSPAVVGEFTEIESGPLVERPALELAIKLAEKQSATLLLPNMDRLVTNSAFVKRLLETQVKFVCLEYPEIDREMLKVRVQFAAFERAKISARTKESLEALIAAGVKLGTPEPSVGGIKRGIEMTRGANAFSKALRPAIRDILKTKRTATLREIAIALENRGIKTARGNANWNASQVRNLLIRLRIDT